jgi:GNAT superfamily N-acetyltransferase
VKSLDVSVTYLLFEGDELCGYARCHDNGGFGMCVWDLLVDARCRGKEYGRLLMEQVCYDYPDNPVYVMSDVDPYYAKLDYEVAGTIYIARPRS